MQSFRAIQSTGELVLELSPIPQSRLDEVDKHTEFLEKINLAAKTSTNEKFVPAVALWDEALAYPSISTELRAKAEEDRARTIQTAVSQTVEGAYNLAKATRYAEALDKVVAIKTALPLTEAQEHELVVLAKELIIGEAQHLASAKQYTEAARRFMAIRERFRLMRRRSASSSLGSASSLL